MGIRCTCGAIVAGTDETTTFGFVFAPPQSGAATYTANVCADRLELSSFMLVFVDTDGVDPNVSFTFISTSIQSVECELLGDACRIEVSGLGVLAGSTEPRQFTVVFVDNPGLNNDNATVITIAGFGSQLDTASLPPGSVTALGCGGG
jgi:hypothetical protein